MLTLALTGGILCLLTLIHIVVDFGFQTHNEAMRKHNNSFVRARHCLVYTLGFVPLFWFCNLSVYEWLFALNLLFWSHYIEDTYIPVMLWAKYVRRPPELNYRIRMEDGVCKVYRANGVPSTIPSMRFANVHSDKQQARLAQELLDTQGFRDFIDTTLGKVLMIVIDQAVHIFCLVPIAYMLVRHVL
ncbi:MAG: DUF3307 domain-containing protein [Candidatus Micrarchaeota archaeon]|nr:DUF3307 domain-containing protein [Candidatus Micrarchaeota archaeon]